MAKKERLDKILVDLGYFETKSKASSAILAGNVMIGTEVITKAGYQLDSTKEYDFRVKSMPYVSRGGFKLKKALETFDVNIKDRICLDAGASTGGFTDCLLQNGAKFVYAADVGYGQLDWKIRSSKQVKTIEKTDPKEKVGVFCRKNKKVGVIEYTEISEEMAHKKMLTITNY